MNMDPALWTGYQIRKFDDRVDAKFYRAILLLIILCPLLLIHMADYASDS